MNTNISTGGALSHLDTLHRSKYLAEREDRERDDGVALDQCHRHVTDDYPVLPETALQFGAAGAPIGQVGFFRHDLEDDNFVDGGVGTLSPQPLCWRLKVGSDAIEPGSQLFLDPIESFPLKWPAVIVRARKQDLEEVHGDFSLKSIQRPSWRPVPSGIARPE
ncbi:hypothetical protein [Mesorhizobium sp.]|uniref:hypothetical protein n=1 Tax=Mesorhizobium sp. TaxID=1871066 RepID=UPI0025C02B90|nr:hypothetical protein [Mesorhizobium sp.]